MRVAAQTIDRGSTLPGEGTAASISSSARISRMIALISERCVNACGKLPRWRPVCGVDLLGVEAERARVGEQLLAQRVGAIEVADLDQRADEPERADRERALLASRVRRRSPRRGSAGRDRRGSARRRSRRPCCGSARRRREGSGSAAAAAARRRARRLVVLDEAVLLGVDAVGEDVLADLVGRRLPAVDLALALRSRASRAPRSQASQQKTFDEVKCLGSPRTSQMPRSRSRQCSIACSTWRTRIGHELSGS